VDAQSGRLFSEEREYGKIPKRIYLQYLQACSVCAGATYLVSTFGWQGLRVYTDYCLNQWTNSGNTGNTTVPHTLDYEVRKFPQALSTDNIVISVGSLVMTDSLYHHFVGHCPLYLKYLMYYIVSEVSYTPAFR
jgi:hypothetical protein